MLITRIITASILALSLGFLLFLGTPLMWQMFFLLVVFTIGYEWSGFAGINALVDKLIWGAMFLLSIILLEYLFLNISFFDALLFVPLALMVLFVVLFQRTKGLKLLTNSYAIFLLGVVIIYAFYYAIISLKMNVSSQIILLSFFVIWAVDVGAYFAGKQFGKTKLASYVSPGKTWEGVFGGILLSAIIAYFGLIFIEPQTNISYFALSIVLSVIGALSIFGDLFESFLKRQVGMKDSSQLLPGHGGVLDRMDSIILAMPLFLLVWQSVSI